MPMANDKIVILCRDYDILIHILWYFVKLLMKSVENSIDFAIPKESQLIPEGRRPSLSCPKLITKQSN